MLNNKYVNTIIRFYFILSKRENSNPVSVGGSPVDTNAARSHMLTSNIAFSLPALSPPQRMKSFEWLLTVAVTIHTLSTTARAATDAVNERDILLEFYQATGASFSYLL